MMFASSSLGPYTMMILLFGTFVQMVKGEVAVSAISTSVVPALSWCVYQDACFGYANYPADADPFPVLNFGEAATVIAGAPVGTAGFIRVADGQSVHGATCTTRSCPVVIFGSVQGQFDYGCSEVTTMVMQGFQSRTYSFSSSYEVLDLLDTCSLFSSGSGSITPNTLICTGGHAFTVKARPDACGTGVCDCTRSFTETITGFGVCASSFSCSNGINIVQDSPPPPTPRPVSPPTPRPISPPTPRPISPPTPRPTSPPSSSPSFIPTLNSSPSSIPTPNSGPSFIPTPDSSPSSIPTPRPNPPPTPRPNPPPVPPPPSRPTPPSGPSAPTTPSTPTASAGASSNVGDQHPTTTSFLITVCTSLLALAMK